MEISHLCAARLGDILNLKHSQILEDGIFIKQGKTGQKQIKQWPERLRSTIDKAALIFPPSSPDSYIILNASKRKLIQKTFNSY